MFEQVLVDEYQDLNALQVEIVRELRREQRGLTVVGDDAQAIYGFRAASAEHILNFLDAVPRRDGGDARTELPLDQPILDLANEVAAGAARAYPKRLRADREGGAAPARLLPRQTPSRRSRSATGCSAHTSRGRRLESRRS